MVRPTNGKFFDLRGNGESRGAEWTTARKDHAGSERLSVREGAAVRLPCRWFSASSAALKAALVALAAAAALCWGPAPAAAVSQREMDAISYEEKVQQLSVGKRQAFLKAVEDEFMTGYAALWHHEDMEGKLRNSVDRAVRRAHETSLFGSESDRLENMERVQQAFLDDYQKEYDPFIKKLEDSFGEICLDKLNAYYGTLVKLRVTALSNMRSARMFYQTSVASRMSWRMGAKTPVSQAYDDVSRSNVKSLIWTAAGGTLIGSLLSAAIPALSSNIGGLVGMFLGGGYGFIPAFVGRYAYNLWKEPDKLREALIPRFIVYFRDERPRQMWLTLRPSISEEIDKLQAAMSQIDEAVKEFIKSEKYGDLTDQMSPEQRRQFDERIVAVRPLDGSVSYSMIIDNFGPFIAQMDIDDVAPLRDVLALGDPFVAKEWLGVAGRSYMDMIRVLPVGIWKKYSPNAESRRVLEWLSKRAVETRDALVRFTPGEVTWVMNEVPSKYVDRLFNREHSDEEIRGEFERLKDLSKENRVPWQGDLSYWLHYCWHFVNNKYSIIGLVVIGLSLVVWGVIVLCRRLKNKCARSRERGIVNAEWESRRAPTRTSFSGDTPPDLLDARDGGDAGRKALARKDDENK